MAFHDRIQNALTGKEKIEGFKFIAVHLPSFNKTTKTAAEHLALARNIIQNQKIQSLVLHPIKIPKEYWIKAAEYNLPIAIENMDKRTTSGYKPNELKQLAKESNTHFVLDIQHAYEQDSNMDYCNSLFNLIKDRLSHLHVSGEKENCNHMLVHKSSNSEQIIKALRKIISLKNIPLTLEGKYTTVEEIKEEIRFLKRKLN